MNWGAQQTEYYASRYFEGMQCAWPERWTKFCGDKNSAALIRTNPDFNRPAIIISGGAASGPLFPGYVGPGLADAVVAGGPFAAPNAYTLYEVGKYLGKQSGVLFLYNNFAGDYLNNDMAQELLEMEGIAVENIPVTDDVASAIGEARENRSGRCGVALLIKIASACAQSGMPLCEIAKVVRHANSRIGTLSMMADFDKNQIVFGNGFSGEPGIKTETHMDMEKTAGQAADILLQDLAPAPGEELVVLINRLRYTSYADGYLMGGLVHKYLSRLHKVRQLRVANYSNIIDIYGFNFTILCVNETLKPYLEDTIYGDSFVL